MPLSTTQQNTQRIRTVLMLLITVLGSVATTPVYAIVAGQYYYFISDKCVAKGPQTPEERGAATPDIMLFEVVPAGISDYYVNMNTQALVHYTEEGQAQLNSLESEQAYTAGKDGSSVHHDFMLQREAITLKTSLRRSTAFRSCSLTKGITLRK